jgi:phage-related protein
MKPILWVASSKKELKKFPGGVQHDIGTALTVAQYGGRAHAVKLLSGFGGGKVLEVVEDHQGDTYRAVYTVKFARAVVVCTAFKRNRSEASRFPGKIWPSSMTACAMLRNSTMPG